MGVKVWYLLAALFLIYVKGEPNDNVPRYYEQPESSSPAPTPSPTPGPQFANTKEVVLYLTSDQVKSLQAAGAVVKPFPSFENDFLQQQNQESDEESAEPQYQPDPENKELKQEELEQFYKELNIQKMNEDLSVQSQSGLSTTEKSSLKYKNSPKLRQQDYFALYTQKKVNKGKSSSIEYVRYLPNYENQELKRERFRADPLAEYRFDAQANIELPGYYQTEAPELKNSEEIQRDSIQDVVEIPSRRLPVANEPVQPQQQRELPAKSPADNKGPGSFEKKLRESAKPWAFVQVKEQSKAWFPANVWEPAKIEESEEIQTPVNIQNYQNVQIPLDGEPLPRELQRTPKISPQTQYSSLLAPLVQLEKIAESIAKEKEELVNHEKEIQNNLRQIKESRSHDEDKYAIELDKLSKNLGKQNALAERLALEISEKSQSISIAENTERLKSAELLEKARKLEPAKVLVSVPAPKPLETRNPSYFAPENSRSIQIPVVTQENIQSPVPTEKKTSASPPGVGNVYVNVDNPYIVQKVVPVGVNHRLPVRFPLRHPDELVLRPLWEHK